MNKDQSHGRIAEVKGEEVAGELVGNRELELKGKVQNARGQAQSAYGDARANIKAALHKK